MPIPVGRFGDYIWRRFILRIEKDKLSVRWKIISMGDRYRSRYCQMRSALVDVRSPSVFLGGMVSDVDSERKPSRDAEWFVDFHPARPNQLHLHLGFAV